MTDEEAMIALYEDMTGVPFGYEPDSIFTGDTSDFMRPNQWPMTWIEACEEYLEPTMMERSADMDFWG